MLQHLYLFSGPLVVLVAIVLGFKQSDLQWFQVPVIMAGAALYDFGWHAWAHHKSQWTAHWSVRVTGFVVVAVGVLV